MSLRVAHATPTFVVAHDPDPRLSGRGPQDAGRRGGAERAAAALLPGLGAEPRRGGPPRRPGARRALRALPLHQGEPPTRR